MFCKNCGERLSDNAKFCPACGTTTVEENEMQNDWQGESFVRQGFSEKINDPAILAATKKNNKIAGILGLFLIPLPIIIALILGVVDDDSSYVGYGIFVSIIIIISSLIYYAKMKLGKQWDGVVIAKNTETHSDMDEDNHGATYTYYVIKIKKDRGGIKKIIARTISCSLQPPKHFGYCRLYVFFKR